MSVTPDTSGLSPDSEVQKYLLVSNGYTEVKAEAGRYYLNPDAILQRGVTSILEDDAPDFSPSRLLEIEAARRAEQEAEISWLNRENEALIATRDAALRQVELLQGLLAKANEIGDIASRDRDEARVQVASLHEAVKKTAFGEPFYDHTSDGTWVSTGCKCKLCGEYDEHEDDCIVTNTAAAAEAHDAETRRKALEEAIGKVKEVQREFVPGGFVPLDPFEECEEGIRALIDPPARMRGDDFPSEFVGKAVVVISS